MVMKLFIIANQVMTTLSVHMLQHFRGGSVYRGAVPSVTYHERPIIICNHQSRIDAFIVFGTLPLRTMLCFAPTKFMTASSIYYSPLRPLLFSLGCYPTKRKGVDIIRYSARLVHNGYGVMMFPEGRRTTHHESRPRSGVSRLLAQTAADTPSIFLARIEWNGRTRFRRRAVVTMQRAPHALDLSSPTAIMAAIYKL